MDERDTTNSDGPQAASQPEPHAEGAHPTGQAGTGQSEAGGSGRKQAPDDTGH